MTEQRFIFGEVAHLYDQLRPGYPDELVERVLAMAELPSHGQVLEVGCGTGQATRSFAARGLAITCLEPSPQMAALALSNLERFARVEIVVETFEDWPVPDRPYDLVISAQAFHWVDPELRFVKAARVLRPGGMLALFGHRPLKGRGPVRQQIDQAYAEHAPTLTAREPGSGPRRPLAADFAQARGFGEVIADSVAWSYRFSAADYVGLLRTQSDHALLPAADRDALLARIESIIDAAGGFHSVDYVAGLLMARRLAI